MKNTNNSGVAAIIIIVIIILIPVLWYNISYISTETSYENITVTDKVRDVKNDGQYLIFTKDNEGEIRVFKITDSWSYGRFNGSDLYGKLTVGETYSKVQAYGFRMPLFSEYENLLSAE